MDENYADVVEVFEGHGGGWYWRLVSNNGEILANSESYTEKDSAIDAENDMGEQTGRPVVVKDG